mmetsp:Transcript_17419/g.33060  ORF Transcript_17419/g.33060 Transcript_17419/m.33060 type:complete len:302 (+) Transcript_17419:1271-2176(+)
MATLLKDSNNLMLVLGGHLSNTIHLGYTFVAGRAGRPQVLVNQEVLAKFDVLSQVSSDVLVVSSNHLHIDQCCSDIFDRLHSGITRRIFDRQDARHHHLYVRPFIVHIHAHRKRFIAAFTEGFVDSLGFRANVFVIENSPFHVAGVIGIVAVEDLGEKAFSDFQMFRESGGRAFLASDCAEGTLYVGVETMVHVAFRAVATVVVVNSRHGHLHLREGFEDRSLDLILLGVFESGAQRCELHNVFLSEAFRDTFQRLVDPNFGKINSHFSGGKRSCLIRTQYVHGGEVLHCREMRDNGPLPR